MSLETGPLKLGTIGYSRICFHGRKHTFYRFYSLTVWFYLHVQYVYTTNNLKEYHKLKTDQICVMHLHTICVE